MASVLAKATWNQQYVQVLAFARLFLMDISSSPCVTNCPPEYKLKVKQEAAKHRAAKQKQKSL